jgi:hypothetical protein
MQYIMMRSFFGHSAAGSSPFLRHSHIFAALIFAALIFATLFLLLARSCSSRGLSRVVPVTSIVGEGIHQKGLGAWGYNCDPVGILKLGDLVAGTAAVQVPPQPRLSWFQILPRRTLSPLIMIAGGLPAFLRAFCLGCLCCYSEPQ